MQITPTDLAKQIRLGTTPRLLDVREVGENDLVRLPDSLLIPLGDLPDHLEALEAWKSEEFIVYCHHGIRSARAVGFLRSMGFSRALNLAGGIDRWATDVDPTLPRY